MVKILCKLCQQCVEADAWKDHIRTGKHTNNLPPHIIIKTTIGKDKIDKVHEYFAKFGKITKKEIISSDESGIRIQYLFEDASTYFTFVKRQHVLFGQNLEIESFKVPDESAVKNSAGSVIKPSCSQGTILIDFQDLRKLLYNSILKETTFAQQIAIIQDKLKVDCSDKEKVFDVIHNDLTAVLKSKFPFCKVYFFGSKVTGLDIVNSKLGIYIDKVRQNNVSENQTLDSVENLILKNEHFENVVRVKKEEFPMIKCRHVTTDTLCYLNVINRLVVKRSELINYYISLDKKVQQFLVMIKLWAKSHVIFEGSSRSYGLHLMAIFYLQQEPYKLPSLLELQKSISPHLENQWNCAFRPITFSSSALEKATILELVTGFFTFYESFDFFEYVVSPFCGYLIEKTRFLQPYQLPDCYSLYMINKQTLDLNSGIVVQDPFEHSKNIFQGTCVASGGRFASFCRAALSLATSGEFQLLLRLLEPANFEKDIFLFKKPTEYGGKDWKNVVQKLTRNMLTEILCCKITKTIPKSDQISYDFMSCGDVWINRVTTFKELESDLFFCGDFEKEVAVTSRIMKTCRKSEEPWNATVHLSFESNKVQVFFTSECKKNETYNLSHFFRLKMEKFFKEAQKANEINSADLVDFKALADTIKETDILSQQIVLLQEKWQQNKIHVEKECKTIVTDLTCAIYPKFSNNIYFSDLNKTALNFPNRILLIYWDKTKQTKVSESTILVTVKTLLEKSGTFSEFSVFIEAGLVKFTHKKTQIRCGLSLKNQNIMIRSTELIRYYLSLDQKLQPLMIIIELWMNYYKLTEAGLMTTYTLQLMVLFYLQQEYKVPSVFDLQKSATAVMIDFWNCAIIATKVTNPKLKKATLMELVQGFFAFYSNFDYISYVVSPFCGFPIEKTKFLKPYDLPEIFKDYSKNDDEIFLNLGLCVQDLFEHSRNLISPQPLQIFSKFTRLCRHTLCLIQQESENFLLNLFLNKVRNLKPVWQFEINKPEKVSAEQWKEKIKNLILKIMKEILTYECTQTSEEGKYECIGLYDVFVNRLNVLKNVVFTGDSEFDKEVAATSYIVREYSRKIQSAVQMELNFVENPYRMKISFSSKSEHFNPYFIDFFYKKLTKCLLEKDKVDGIEDIDDTEVIGDENTEKIDIIEVDSSPGNSNQQLDLVGSKEDVPSDFFDDFSDDEFLDGLNIVDCYDHKEKRSKRQSRNSKERKSLNRQKKRYCSKSPTGRTSKRYRSRDERGRSLSRSPFRRSLSKSRSRRSRSRSNSNKSRSRSTSRDARFSRHRENKESAEVEIRGKHLSRRRERTEKGTIKRKYSRSKSRDLRSPSPRKGRFFSPDRNEELKKKQSCLQEIREKINKTEPPITPQTQNMSVPLAAVTVPPTNCAISPSDTTVQNSNQSFFIGTQTYTGQNQTAADVFCTEKSILKLYEEKKISFCDYLAIRAKQNATSLTLDQLLRKARVIYECQEAIKVLDRTQFGRLLVPISESSTESDDKHKSPLLRTITKFKFTNPYKSKSEIEVDTFSTNLYKILQKLDIFKQENNILKLLDSVAEALSSGAKMDKEIAAQIFQISVLNSLAVNEPKRKIEVATQCKENNNVAVQVNENDLNRKNQ